MFVHYSNLFINFFCLKLFYTFLHFSLPLIFFQHTPPLTIDVCKVVKHCQLRVFSSNNNVFLMCVNYPRMHVIDVVFDQFRCKEFVSSIQFLVNCTSVSMFFCSASCNKKDGEKLEMKFY